MPRTALIIATLGSPAYVALQLESRRRFAPDVPTVVHDDCSVSRTELESLCHQYGVGFLTTATHTGHYCGDMLAYANGLQWADSIGAEWLVKISRRFVWILPWLDRFEKLTATTTHDTIGNPCRAFGWRLRTECFGMRVKAWLPQIPAMHEYTRLALLPNAENWLATLPPGKSLEPWAMLGLGRYDTQPGWLWYNTCPPDSYQAQAAAWGLDYPLTDFEHPEHSPLQR